MNKTLKRWLGIVLAVAVVVIGCFALVDTKLHASEDDGSTTASEQQADANNVEVVNVSTEELDSSAEAFEKAIFEDIFASVSTGESDFVATVNITANQNGNQVELVADVEANANYKISWEYNSGNGWKSLNAYGRTYTFTSSKETAGNQYRAVVTKDNA